MPGYLPGVYVRNFFFSKTGCQELFMLFVLARWLRTSTVVVAGTRNGRILWSPFSPSVAPRDSKPAIVLKGNIVPCEECWWYDESVVESTDLPSRRARSRRVLLSVTPHRLYDRPLYCCLLHDTGCTSDGEATTVYLPVILILLIL